MLERWLIQCTFKTVMKDFDKTTSSFFLCQLRNRGLKPKGRSFSIEDKIMALSLFKQSARGYRLLSRFFSLPSRKTIISLLSGIPFDTGINERIFTNLKKSVQRLKNRDKCCVLLLDEVSIAANLEYNQHVDEVIGWKDLGSDQVFPEFEDQAFVFMVRGI